MLKARLPYPELYSFNPSRVVIIEYNFRPRPTGRILNLHAILRLSQKTFPSILKGQYIK